MISTNRFFYKFERMKYVVSSGGWIQERYQHILIEKQQVCVN